MGYLSGNKAVVRNRIPKKFSLYVGSKYILGLQHHKQAAMSLSTVKQTGQHKSQKKIYIFLPLVD